MPASNLKVLLTVTRTEGLREVLNRLAFRFLRVHTFVVYRMRLSPALPDGEIPAGIEFREASTAELAKLRQGRSDLPEYFYRDLTDTAAERCWVGLENGKLGFVAWISYRGSSDLVRVGRAEAELAYIYCLKELRGRHLTANAVLVIARTLLGEGITSLLAVPNSLNPAIIKSFVRCGFVRVGSIRRFFGLFTWPRPPVDFTKLP